MLYASPPLLHRLLSLGGILVPGGVLYLSCLHFLEQGRLELFAPSTNAVSLV